MNPDSTAKKTILFICPDFNENNILMQPWRHLFEVASSLKEEGHSVHILTSSKDVEKEEVKQVCGLNTVIIKTLIPLSPSRVKSINKWILFFRPEAIYWFASPSTVIYPFLAGSQNIPIIFHISGGVFTLAELKNLSLKEIFSFGWTFPLYLIPFFKRLVAKCVNAHRVKWLVVASSETQRRLIEWGVCPQKIKVAPLALAQKTCSVSPQNQIRKKLALSPQTFIVTYAGSPATLRGTDTLLSSISILKSSDLDLKILMLLRCKEETNDRRYLQCLIDKQGIGRYVTVILGVLTAQEVMDYLCASDVCVFPFKIVPSEPPLALLEALSLGKQVIATRVGDLPEIIERSGGILANPADPSDLAKTILFLANNKSLIQRGRDKALLFSSRFVTWADLARWTIKLIDVNDSSSR